ncbi:MAG TPA: ABC transporter substrate-binding protein [Bradyrhizobium sp.]|nr:ABC transporter substrate-binding protein [Bradyrhizobium sp.]
MKRRDFIGLLGGTVTWPLATRAQGGMPVVGYLSSFSPETNRKLTEAFREGLEEAGFREGRNINIEYRWAEEGHYETLPTMAAELANRRVSVIFATPIPAALAAKAATVNIPIVFAVGSDPVGTGLVTSLNRPSGNATGATFLSVELGSKRLELLRDLAPKIVSVGLLVNPHNPNAAPQTKEMEEATRALGLRFDAWQASAEGDFNNVFRRLRQQNDALVVSADPFFMSHGSQLVALAVQYLMPTMYYAREFVLAGGLISYASSFEDSFRRAATYVARILKGEKPADLPVIQPTKFELVLNLKTANALGLTVPPTLLARADEVIE